MSHHALMTASETELKSLMESAIQFHADARLAEAERVYRQILALQPDHPDALNALAVVMWQMKKMDQALECVTRAIGAAPTVWRYHETHGLIASSMYRHVESRDAFQRVCDNDPQSASGWLGLARALHALDRFDEAVAAYRRARILAPLQIEMLNNFGVALEACGEPQAAADAYRDGLVLQPDFVPLYNNLGNTLAGLRHFDAAFDVFRRGLALDSANCDLWFNYGNALAAQGAVPDAIDAYHQALKIDPEHGKSWVNLANALRAHGDHAASVRCCERAIIADPRSHDAYNNMGVALLSMGKPDAALDALMQAIEIQPDSSVAHNNMGNAFKDAGRIEDAVAAYRHAIILAPQDVKPHSNLVYSLYFHPAFGEAAILQESVKWASAHARPIQVKRSMRGFAGRQCLRVGYVSPDFREHCQSFFTMPLFANHDHQAFKIHCYSDVPVADATTDRIAAMVDAWRPIYGVNHAEVAKMIRSDGIDVLVDLTMHMSNGRPLLFARRPAPIQIAWLAYPGTTGQTAIDYRLTDPWLDPPELGDHRYAERSLRLPHTFWCYDAMDDQPPVSPLPALAAGFVTFGCLNNFCKVSNHSLELWGKVMARVPGSRLILMAANGRHRSRVYEAMEPHHIGADRIEFVTFRPRVQYLETYHRIDICLDTLPYNGHTTSLDAYWMGVPVVTRVGDTVVGRAGWSQLNNLGLTHLAAFDDIRFIRAAVSLSADLHALAAMRHTLRDRMQRSPLMDAKSFAAAMEFIYWRVTRS